MRILEIVTRSEVGGAQSVVRTLAEELTARGHMVAIAYGPEGEAEAWQGMSAGIEKIELPHLVRAVSPLHDLRACGEISSLYRHWHPDIVHLHTSKAAALGRLAPGAPVPRIVYTMHGYDQLKISNRAFLAFDAALKRRCAAVVAVSDYDSAHMQNDGYTPIYIPNGVREITTMPEAPAAVLERIARIKSQKLPLVLAIARDAPPKRLDIVREAAALLVGKMTFVWIGGEPSPRDPANFFALGVVPHAGSLLQYADAYVLASDHEGMPMSILEAFSAGVPVVASMAGGIPQLMGYPTERHGAENGLIYTREDGFIETERGYLVRNRPYDIARALTSLAERGETRAGMGSRVRKAWQEEYSAARMAERYEALFRELLQGRRNVQKKEQTR